MKLQRYTWLALFAFISYYSTLSAQTIPAPTHTVYSVRLLDESISLPGAAFLDYGVEPTIILGASRNLSVKPHHDWFVGADLGFFHHRTRRNAAFLLLEGGYRYRAGQLGVSLSAGPGLGWVFLTSQAYSYQDGQYLETTDRGSFVFKPTVATVLSYRLKKDRNAPEILLEYRLSVESPFAVLPVPHLYVGVGIRANPFRKN